MIQHQICSRFWLLQLVIRVRLAVHNISHPTAAIQDRERPLPPLPRHILGGYECVTYRVAADQIFHFRAGNLALLSLR